jgi:hypothetical protein
MVSIPRDSGGNVEEYETLHFAAQYASLNSSAYGNYFVRVNGLVGLLTASNLFDKLLYSRDTGTTTDEYYFVEVVVGELGVFESLLHRLAATLYQVSGEVVKASASRASSQGA